MDTVTSNPEIMHGAACFAGTRVQVKSLFDYLVAGHSIDQFLADFPSVQRDQIIKVLRHSQQASTSSSQVTAA